MEKLVYVKGKLKEWNKTSFGNLELNKVKLHEELSVIDKLLEDNVGGTVELGTTKGGFVLY